MAALDEGSWSEIALIEVGLPNVSGVQFASKIEDFDPAEGARDNTYAALTNGGRVMKRVPEEEFEMTAKLYEVELGAAQSLAQFFVGGSGTGSQFLSLQNSKTRNRLRISILWTEDPTPTTASASVATGYAARRTVVTNARVTEYKEAWEDKTLVINAKFKAPAFNVDATANITRQSVTAAGTGLTALNTYT